MSFKIKVGDKIHEVEASAITVPDGYVLHTQGRMDQIVEDAKHQASKNAIEGYAKPEETKATLLKDDAFYTEILKSRGVEVKDGKIVTEVSEEQRASLRESFRKEELEPEREKLKKLTEQIEEARKQSLLGSIQAAASEAGVKKALLKSPLGAHGAFVRDLADSAKWNEERQGWDFHDADGQPVRDSDGRPISVEGYVKTLREADQDHTWFESSRPSRTGIFDQTQPEPSQNGAGKTLSVAEMTALQMSDPDRHAKIMEEHGESANWTD